MDSKATLIPQKINLTGKYCRLEPLNDSIHGSNLWSSTMGHDYIWDYMLDGPWPNETQFRHWLKERETHPSRVYYAIIDPKSNSALGALCLMDCDLKNKTTEVGGIFFSPQLQKTTIATESIFLLMNYAFEIGYRRLQWKCNDLNQASKKAAQRFGFTQEGLFRQHMIVRGKNRDSAFFSILDSEWSNKKLAFERWLNENNFDEQGIQKTKL